MLRTIRFNSVAIIIIASLQLLFTTNASASTRAPLIHAEAECVHGTTNLWYFASSWSANAFEGENAAIEIRVNGVLIDTGAFVYPGNSFSGVTALPAGETVTVEALATGNWGDGSPGGQSSSTTISVPVECLVTAEGRFTGGGHQIRIADARVTRGLTIHCDLLLSNNLEVNWGGNQFHMTEHLTTVACTDDPNIVQFPPAAPLDTLVGVGTGRYNGTDGFTIEFTLVDQGEPGRGVDEAALLIYETADPTNVVLDIPLQVITGGNLQAHYDQPHK